MGLARHRAGIAIQDIVAVAAVQLVVPALGMIDEMGGVAIKGIPVDPAVELLISAGGVGRKVLRGGAVRYLKVSTSADADQEVRIPTDAGLAQSAARVSVEG